MTKTELKRNIKNRKRLLTYDNRKKIYNYYKIFSYYKNKIIIIKQ